MQYLRSYKVLKIQDEQGKDLFIVEDDAKEPKQVAEVKKKKEVCACGGQCNCSPEESKEEEVKQDE